VHVGKYNHYDPIGDSLTLHSQSLDATQWTSPQPKMPHWDQNALHRKYWWKLQYKRLMSHDCGLSERVKWTLKRVWKSPWSDQPARETEQDYWRGSYKRGLPRDLLVFWSLQTFGIIPSVKVPYSVSGYWIKFDCCTKCFILSGGLRVKENKR